MDLKTEEIVKILLILGVLYLLFNCITTENFADTDFTRIKIALKSENKTYRLVSFFNLKDEYKLLLLKELKKIHKEEEDSNAGKTEGKTANSFFNFGSTETELVSLTSLEKEDEIKERLNKLSGSNISKIPVLIIANDKLSEYTNGVFDFATPSSNTGNGLESDSGRYLFWNPAHNMLFTSTNDSLKFEIKGTHSTVAADKQAFLVIALKDKENKDITPNKIEEKTININDKTFTHYVLSNTEGSSFEWKWYADKDFYDFSKIL